MFSAKNDIFFPSGDSPNSFCAVSNCKSWATMLHGWTDTWSTETKRCLVLTGDWNRHWLQSPSEMDTTGSSQPMLVVTVVIIDASGSFVVKRHNCDKALSQFDAACVFWTRQETSDKSSLYHPPTPTTTTNLTDLITDSLCSNTLDHSKVAKHSASQVKWVRRRGTFFCFLFLHQILNRKLSEMMVWYELAFLQGE